MRRSPNSRVSSADAAARPAAWWSMALLLAAGSLMAWKADASSALCPAGQQCASPALDISTIDDRSLLEFAAAARLQGMSARRDELSSQEYFSFSGVGAVVCTVDGEQRMSTAFLVGAFDLGVTVAHTFEDADSNVDPQNCFYTSTDSLGQIRERIPVSYIKSQWRSEAGANGHAAKDFAVIKLSEPSNYAQRTMPMGKFSGGAAPVVMVGFRDDIEIDPLKAKSRGTVFERKANGFSLAHLEGFTHDIDARGIAAGAPVIDERTGVIIGIHTMASQPKSGARNTMITMNEWLEETLRAELQSTDEKGADSRL